MSIISRRASRQGRQSQSNFNDFAPRVHRREKSRGGEWEGRGIYVAIGNTPLNYFNADCMRSHRREAHENDGVRLISNAVISNASDAADPPTWLDLYRGMNRAKEQQWWASSAAPFGARIRFGLQSPLRAAREMRYDNAAGGSKKWKPIINLWYIYPLGNRVHGNLTFLFARLWKIDGLKKFYILTHLKLTYWFPFFNNNKTLI